MNFPDTSPPVALPPWTTLGNRLESLIRKACYDFSLLDGIGPKLALALSGGKDSLALLFFLKAISGRGFPPFELHAIHIDGEFSCGAGVSLSYLQAICEALKVPLTVKNSARRNAPLECYSCSRERRSLLFAATKEIGATTLAFGHHRDDHAQTLLMNLLHKGEFAGLLAKVPMHDYGVSIIRPLLYVAEDEIRRFAKAYGFARITCQCPVGQRSMRKKTDQLLEDLETLYPNARANIASAGWNYGSQKAAIGKLRSTTS